MGEMEEKGLDMATSGNLHESPPELYTAHPIVDSRGEMPFRYIAGIEGDPRRGRVLPDAFRKGEGDCSGMP